MALQPPSNQNTVGSASTNRFADEGARDRVETERVVLRKRHAWRIIPTLVVSAILLLLALGLRRDQLQREGAIEELQITADRIDKWVHERGALPTSFRSVFGQEKAEALSKQYQYTDRERMRLTAGGNMPVLLAFGRSPRGLLLSQDGRPVMLYLGGNFDVRWLSESEFRRYRLKEEAAMQKGRETPGIHP